MFCPAQSDTLGAQLDCHLRIGRCVGIGTDLQGPDLIGIAHECVVVLEQQGILRFHHTIEDLDNFRRLDGNLGIEDLSGKTVDRNIIAFLHYLALDGQRSLRIVDRDIAGTGNTRATHTTGNYGRMAGHTTTGRYDTLGNSHATDILGAGLDPGKNHILANGSHLLGLVGGEIHLSAGAAGACIQTLGNLDKPTLRNVLAVQYRSEQLVEFTCRNTGDSGFL